MKKICNKFLSIIICIMLVVSCMPITAFAQEDYPDCELLFNTQNVSDSADNGICSWSYDSTTKTVYIDCEFVDYYADENGADDLALPVFKVLETGERQYCYRFLEHIVFSNKVSGIYASAAAEFFPKLKTVTFEEGSNLYEIGDSCFEYAQITDITLPNTLQRIGAYAFEGAQLTHIKIPASVNTINSYAFYNSKLESIDFDNRTSTIRYGTNVFSGTNLTSFDFNECGFSGSITPKYMFRNCTKLKTVVLTDITDTIAMGTFENCSSLVNIDLSNIVQINELGMCRTGIKTLDNDCIEVLGQSAFQSCENLRSVNLPNLTEMGRAAFSRCSVLEEVNLGNITDIEQYAFSYTPALKHFDFSKITGVGGHSFYKSGLTEANMSNVHHIGAYAFQYDTDLESVVLSQKLTDIEEYVFSGCTSAKFNNLPSSLENIGRYAFENSGITSVKLPPARNYNEGIFSGCKALTDVEIEEGVVSVQDKMFMDCTALKKVKLPKTLKRIGIYGFKGCSSLEEILVYYNTSTVDDYAFADCESLSRVIFTKYSFTTGTDIFQNSNPVIYSAENSTAHKYAKNKGLVFKAKGSGDLSEEIENLIEDDGMRKEDCSGTWANGTWHYSEDKTVLYIDGKGELTNSDIKNSIGGNKVNFNAVVDACHLNKISIVIGEGITSIPKQILSNTKQIVTLTLPNSLTSIGNKAFYTAKIENIEFGEELTTIGNEAFYGCNTRKLVFPENSKLTSVLSSAFYDNKLTEFNFPKTVTEFGNQALHGSDFAEIDLTGFSPDTIFGEYMFEGSCAQSINFGEIKNISNYMFSNCYGLTSVDIPSTVQSVGIGAFQYCKALVSASLPSEMTIVTNQMFFGCETLTNIDLSNVINVKSSAFSYCKNLENVNLEKVETVGATAFFGCKIKEAYLPNATTIDTGAFRNCSELTSVSAEKVQKIDSYAFANCPKLTNWEYSWFKLSNVGSHAFDDTGFTEIYIEKGIVYGSYCFANCVNLEKVVYEKDVTSIPEGMFSKCYSLKNKTLPDVTKIGNYAFEYNTSLENIVFPKTLKSIGNYAYRGCTMLKSVVIPINVDSIGMYAFSGCNAMNYAVVTKFAVNIGKYAFPDTQAFSLIGERFSSASDYCDNFIAGFINCVDDKYLELYYDEFSYMEDIINNNAYDRSYFVEVIDKATIGTWENGSWQYSYDKSTLYFIGDGILTDTMESADGESMRFDDIIRKGEGNITVRIGGGITGICDNFAKTDESVYITNLILEPGIKTVRSNAFFGVKIKDLTINDELTSIGANAFNNCQLENVIANINTMQLETVGEYAFANNSLTGFSGLNRIKVIGAHAFENNLLQSFSTTSDEAVIGDYAFACNKLSKITVNSTSTFGKYVFANSVASNITVSIGDGITEIADGMFCGCTGIKTITIPASVTRIGNEAFLGISIKEIAFENNISHIGDKAFFGCESLQKVTFGENVEYIGSAAFNNCLVLGEVNFNNDQTEIYTDTVNRTKSAIGYNTNGNVIYSTIIYGGANSTALVYANEMGIPFFATDIESEFSGYITDNPANINTDNCVQWTYFENVDTIFIFGKGSMIGDFYDAQLNRLETKPTAKKVIIASGINALYTPLCDVNPDEIVVPETVAVVRDTFRNCKNIEYVNLPDSVTTLYPYTFEGCKSLKTLSLGKGIKNIPERCAEGCVNLKFLYMYGVTTINEFAFQNCSSLQTLTFPDSIATIRRNAFANCYSIFKIYFGKNLESVGSRAFANLHMLDTVVFYGNVGYIDDSAFDDSGDMTLGIDVVLGDEVERTTLTGFSNVNVKSVELGKAFVGFDYYFEMPTLKEYILSDENETGLEVYKGCLYKNGVLLSVPQGVESIEIKQDAIAIGDDAFRGSSVNTVRIPSTVKTIGENAFYMAQNLKAVRFSSGVESIGNSAFENCVKLKTVNIPYPCKTIGNKAFKGCKILASVILPEGILSIGFDCFSGCALEGIVFPKSLETLGAGALSYNPNLKSVYVWNPTMGYKVFNQSSVPNIYTMAGSTAHGYARTNNIPYNVYTDEEIFADICFDAIDILSGYLGYCTDGHGDIEWLTVYEGSCDHDGYAIGVCEYCSEILDERHSEAQGHKYFQVAYIEETATDYGIRVLKCGVCSQYLTTYYEPLDEYKPSIGVYTVSGKIEADTGKVVSLGNTSIENADIYINGSLVASTDENGHFKFKMKAGNYIMEIRYAYGFSRYVGLSITDHDISLTDKEAIRIVACDFNKDGAIDSADQALFMLVTSSKKGDASYLKFVDLNNDGVINAKDYMIIERFIGSNALTYQYPELTIS